MDKRCQEKREPQRHKEHIALSFTESKILKYFIEHKGEIITREELLKAIWRCDSTSTRRVDMHVSNLRKKIEHIPNDPRYIITEHGLGYRFLGSVEVLKIK